MDLTFEIWAFVLSVVGIAVTIIGIVLRYIRPPGKREKEYSRKVSEFKKTRVFLKNERTNLILKAFDYYRSVNPDFISLHCNVNQEFFDSVLLTKREWIPNSIIPLEKVRALQGSGWDESVRELHNPDFHEDKSLLCAVKNLEFLWPKKKGSNLIKYSDLIGEQDPPKLWWNDPSYMLLDVKTENEFVFSFKVGLYWDYVDTLEALAFESADCLRKKGNVQFSKLEARKKLGDAIDFKKRYSGFGVLTVSIFAIGNTYRFIMHQRSKRNVATSEGVVHVVPAGDFQPSSNSESVFARDLDFWRNIMREFNEEVINPSLENSHIEYQIEWEKDELFKTLSHYKEKGGIRAYFLGFGLDPLNLKPLLLTAVVFSEEAFKRIVPRQNETNLEGNILWNNKGKDFNGFPFDENGISYFLSKPDLEVGGRACLIAAWNSRDKLIK